MIEQFKAGAVLGAFALVTSLAACSSAGGVREQLDQASGLTVVSETSTMTFARTQAQLSRSARDYVFLGPVEINERGIREYYLWVGIASTIDRGFLGANGTDPDTLYLDFEGAPVEFELQRWGDRVPALRDFDVYHPDIEPDLVLSARVTLDQLLVLSQRSIPSLQIATRDGTAIEYFLWNQAEPWPAFASQAR